MVLFKPFIVGVIGNRRNLAHYAASEMPWLVYELHLQPPAPRDRRHDDGERDRDTHPVVQDAEEAAVHGVVVANRDGGLRSFQTQAVLPRHLELRVKEMRVKLVHVRRHLVEVHVRDVIRAVVGVLAAEKICENRQRLVKYARVL